MTETICYILAMVGVLLYFIGEGITQGFTFASKQRRKSNPIVRNTYKRLEGEKGFLTYHGVRIFIENLGMLLVLISAFFININFFMYAWFLLGWTGIGLFIYERMFNLVSYGELFPKKANYDLNKINFKRTWKQDFIVLFIGIGLLVFYQIVI